MDDGIIAEILKEELAKCLRTRKERADAVMLAREKEGVAKRYGQFEYELRYGPGNAAFRDNLAYANGWLASFEEMLTDEDRNVYAVFKANGGPPVPEPDEGVYVKRWRRQH